jgi:hypothetical protein
MDTALTGARVAVEAVASRILIVRGLRVIVDADLAALYGVPTKRLNEQVRRNSERFPADFLFQLTPQEVSDLKSQIATSSSTATWGGRRHAPFVFTEHGALMASTVLNSPRAVEVSVFVVRAFVQLRELATGHKELAHLLRDLEARIKRKLVEQDETISGILEALGELMEPPEPERRQIGFAPLEEKKTQR